MNFYDQKPRKLIGLAMILIVAAITAGTYVQFRGGFATTTTLTVMSDRSGLVLERGSKITYNGVQIGRVSDIAVTRDGDASQARLTAEVETHSVREDVPPAIAGAQLVMVMWAVGARYQMLHSLDGPEWEPQIQRALLPVRRRGSEVIAAGQRDGSFADHLPPATMASVVEAVAQTLLENANDGPDSALTAAQAVLIALGVSPARARSAARRAWESFDGLFTLRTCAPTLNSRRR